MRSRKSNREGEHVLIAEIVPTLFNQLIAISGNGFFGNEIFFPHKHTENRIFGLYHHGFVSNTVLIVRCLEIEIGQCCIMNGRVDRTPIAVWSPDTIHSVAGVVLLRDAIKRAVLLRNRVHDSLTSKLDFFM